MLKIRDKILKVNIEKNTFNTEQHCQDFLDCLSESRLTDKRAEREKKVKQNHNLESDVQSKFQK